MIEYLIRIAIAVFILLSFYGIARLVTRGWREVSGHYGFSGIFSGKKYYFRSGSFAGSNFGWLLIIGGNRDGMYLSAVMPSRLCPPLLIPWDDITGVERRGLLTREVELRFVHDYRKSQENNCISSAMAGKLEVASSGRWTYRHATRRVILGKDEYR